MSLNPHAGEYKPRICKPKIISSKIISYSNNIQTYSIKKLLSLRHTRINVKQPSLLNLFPSITTNIYKNNKLQKMPKDEKEIMEKKKKKKEIGIAEEGRKAAMKTTMYVEA